MTDVRQPPACELGKEHYGVSYMLAHEVVTGCAYCGKIIPTTPPEVTDARADTDPGTRLRVVGPPDS